MVSIILVVLILTVAKSMRKKHKITKKNELFGENVIFHRKAHSFLRKRVENLVKMMQNSIFCLLKATNNNIYEQNVTKTD